MKFSDSMMYSAFYPTVCEWIVQCNEPPHFVTDWNVRPIVQTEFSFDCCLPLRVFVCFVISD